MLGSVFRELETDPFFDFGNSPFNQHPFFREGPANYFHPHRQPLSTGHEVRRRPALEAPSKPDDGDGLEGEDRKDLVRRDEKRRGDQERQLERYDRHRPRGRDYNGRNDAGDLAFPSMFGHGGEFEALERNFNQMFSGMHRMMANMGDHMRQMEAAAAREDFNGHMYSHASVYSRGFDGADDKAGGGEPHVYQAMSETVAGPGGVRATRKAMRDSRTRDERMAVGRHIGPRSHVTERRRNTGTGEQHEDHRYSGVGEAESDAFDREWHSRATALGRGGGVGNYGGRSRPLRDRRSGDAAATDTAAAAVASERPAIRESRHKL